MCQFPTNISEKEGATVAASHLPSQRSWLSPHRSLGRTGSVSTETTLQEAPIKYHKCPTFDANRNAGDFQIYQLIDSPKQMNQNKTNKDADESEKTD